MYVIFWRPAFIQKTYSPATGLPSRKTPFTFFNEGKLFFSPQSLTRRNKHMKRVKGKGKEPLGTSLQLGIQLTLSVKTDTFGTGTRCPSCRGVRLIESQIKGVKKGRDQL